MGRDFGGVTGSDDDPPGTLREMPWWRRGGVMVQA